MYHTYLTCITDVTERHGLTARKLLYMRDALTGLNRRQKLILDVLYVQMVDSPENKKKREQLYLRRISEITFPSALKGEYLEYMESLHWEDRMKYYDKLVSMDKETLTSHMSDMYMNPFSELDRKLKAEFSELEHQQRKHTDLYGFKTNDRSMVLITMAFLKKIRLIDPEDRKPYYKAYANVDVNKLRSKGVPTDKIKSKILVGLITHMVDDLSEEEQRTLIDNLFDKEWSLSL